MTGANKTVLVELRDGIAWVTMNRPEKKNAISVAMAREMVAVLDRLETERGREEGMRQFLDEKSYRPGLGPYRRRRRSD